MLTCIFYHEIDTVSDLLDQSFAIMRSISCNTVYPVAQLLRNDINAGMNLMDEKRMGNVFQQGKGFLAAI